MSGGAAAVLAQLRAGIAREEAWLREHGEIVR
jgi:hypothetical protein